jgi:hypothetical protein
MMKRNGRKPPYVSNGLRGDPSVNFWISPSYWNSSLSNWITNSPLFVEPPEPGKGKR